MEKGIFLFFFIIVFVISFIIQNIEKDFSIFFILTPKDLNKDLSKQKKNAPSLQR